MITWLSLGHPLLLSMEAHLRLLQQSLQQTMNLRRRKTRIGRFFPTISMRLRSLQFKHVRIDPPTAQNRRDKRDGCRQLLLQLHSKLKRKLPTSLKPQTILRPQHTLKALHQVQFTLIR